MNLLRRLLGEMETPRLVLRHWRESDLEDFLAFAADKARAAMGRFRIRETALLSLALAGGALGALAAMHLCRHKIRTPRFAWGVPVLLAVQCALLAWGSAMG